MPSFKTIQAPSESVYKELKSRFLSYAYPIQSEEDVKPLVFNLKNKYFDARHHCYAYRIGIGKDSILRTNDDREPSHSAGEPILAAIDSKELTDILIVVVRYFGGIKLGAANLSKAYRQAALNAINIANIITQTPQDNIDFTFDFAIMGQVNKFLKDNNFTKKNILFHNSNTIRITFDSDLKEQLLTKLNSIYGIKIL